MREQQSRSTPRTPALKVSAAALQYRLVTDEFGGMFRRTMALEGVS